MAYDIIRIVVFAGVSLLAISARPGSEWHGGRAGPNLVAERFDPISERGFSALEKRASAGDAGAQYEVGARFAEGIGVAANPAKGYDWLRKAAEHGEIRAQRRVGGMLLAGTGTTASPEQGLGWLVKSAGAGDPQAELDLAVAYFNGTGIAQDDGRAFHWFLKVAQLGDARAERSVGVMLAQGKGVAKDFKAAREWLEKAAAQSEPEALYNLAMMYFRGEGAPQDSKTGVSFLVRSAISGDVEAEPRLVAAYATGVGVTEDRNKMRELAGDAATGGSAEGQAYLGQLFSAGTDGRPPDYSKARLWLGRAAAQGLAPAQAAMGRMCQDGIGGPKDDIEALKWFCLAADQGLEEAVWRRDEVALFADSSQKQEARHRAGAFKPAPSLPIPDDEGEAAVCPLGDAFEIPATIFGETKHLVVDTGSDFAVLDVANRSRLGEPLALAPISTALSAGTEFPIYSCPGIRIASRQFAPLWTVCDDLHKLRLATGEPCDGILGRTCLRHYVVCFDCDEHTCSIGGPVPEGLKKRALAVPLKTVPTNRGLAADANLNGLGPFSLAIDSGDDGCITLNEHDWQIVFAHQEPKTALVRVGALGNQVAQAKLARLETVQIGTNHYTNLIAGCLLEGSTLPSRLGQAFIRRHLLGIDFPNRTLYLAPGRHFADLARPNVSGLYPAKTVGKIVVYSVEEGSPAFRAGIRQDDRIISINGLEASSLRLNAFRQMLEAKPGTKIGVVVRRGEQTRQFQFALPHSI
jgi:hypothetical protein